MTMRILRNTILVLATLWSIVLLPEQALAQTASLTCSAGTVSGGEFFDDQPNTPGSACQFSVNSNGPGYHIFSAIFCQFVNVLNSVLGSVYCGMQDLLKTAVGATLTLYIAIFGGQMLMGMAELNAREFITRIAKIVCVWVFISQSVWAVQYAFQFFVLLAGEGVNWVMQAIPSPFSTQMPPPVCVDPSAASATGFMAAFARLDAVICNAVSGPLNLSAVNSKLIGFFIVLFLLSPQIGALVVSWLLLNLKILLQGLVTVLLGVAAITFLLAMSPIFLCLMLFKATVGFFENWLKYMMSFSLQIIIVFACISLWLTVTVYFITFFNDLSSTIFAQQSITDRAAPQSVNDSWGVCPFDYYPDSAAAGAPPGTPPGPYVKCQNPGFNPTTSQADKDAVIPISGLLWTNQPPGGSSTTCRNLDPTMVTLLNDCTKYLYYMIYHLITLIIVSFAFEALLREAPMIAVYLTGPDYVSPLAPGMGVNRAGQVRSLFSSSSSSQAAASSGDGSSGFSLKKIFSDLTNANNAPPGTVAGKSTARAPTTAENTTQTYRERFSPMITNKPDSVA
jgi:TrbL/VirB6 plasmid conjugal transfer protein